MYDESVHPKLYEYNQYNENQETGLRRWQRPWDLTGINPSIWTTPDDSYNYNEPEALPEHAQEVYSPFWQRSPVEDFAAFAGLDLYSVELFTKVIDGMLEMDHPVLTEVTDASFLSLNYDKRFPPQAAEMPHLYLLQPIYDTLFENRTTVGFLSAFLRFGAFFDNILNDEQYGILIVLESSCGQQFSYQLKGRDAHFMGKADLHDTHYDGQLKEFDIVPFAKLEETEERKYCQYRAKIFPSDDYRDQFLSENPIIYAALIVSAFLVTALVFTVYDIMVTRRQKAMMDTATKTNAIVSSLFPKTVRERMMEELENTAAPKKEKAQASKEAFKLMNESSASNAGDTVATSEAIFGSKPIADLFPSTTIMCKSSLHLLLLQFKHLEPNIISPTN